MTTLISSLCLIIYLTGVLKKYSIERLTGWAHTVLLGKVDKVAASLRKEILDQGSRAFKRNCAVACSNQQKKCEHLEVFQFCFNFQLHLENIFFYQPGEYEAEEANVKGGDQLLQRKVKEVLLVETVQIKVKGGD